MTDHSNNPRDAARCCDEFTRRALMRRAVSGAASHVPLPGELLDAGAGNFFERPVSRKQFVAGGTGLFLGLAAAQAMAPWDLLERAAAAEAATPDAPILVSIYLGGGNDGLNTLVPRDGAERANYDGYRTKTRLAPEQLLPIEGRPDLGWHPSATGLRDLYDAGLLAAYTGVDYPDPNMSHFESEHYWRTGTVSNREKFGWLGRYLDIAGTGNPLEGIAVQWGGDGALLGKRAAACSVHDPGAYRFSSPGVWDSKLLQSSWGKLGSGVGRSSAYRHAVATTRRTAVVARTLQTLARQEGDAIAAPPVVYPEGYQLGEELRTLGRLLGAGLGTRIATLVDSQGYDTHDDQLTVHAGNLDRLSRALVAWQADLEARGLADRVVTMVWSEFGRRASDNESAGTDHGAGGLLLLLGRRVEPGIHSEGWGLSRLDDDGNLQVTTDFRNVYAGLLEGHLRVAPRDVLPGYGGAPAALMRAA